MTKTNEISAKEWRNQFAQGDCPDHAVAENMVSNLMRKGQRGGGSRRGDRRHASSKIPTPSKLVGDIPGSHILENRDVRDPIIAFLQVHGWFARINWQGPYSYPGVPDIEAIRDSEVVMIECKRPGEGLRVDQERFRDDWIGHGGKWIKAERVEDVEWMAKRGAQS